MSRPGASHVLVTGASGFIGGELVRTLLRRGVRVTATARRPTAALEAQLGTDVRALDLAEPLPPFDGVDTVVHCATPNDIVSRAADGGIPLAVMGTRTLLDHALAHGVARLVFLSTLQVYGTELTGRIDEDTPARCETPYGLNHFLGEEICRFYAQTTPLDVVALRPANVYGVPASDAVDRWTLVPMCFVREAFERGALTLRSSGRQRRNFVSTGEVADEIGSLVDDFPPGYTVRIAASDWYASIVDIAAITAECWRRERGEDLPIRVLSDEPVQAGTFTLSSRSPCPRLLPEASRERMTEVIATLIRTYKTKEI